jgi:Arc/MetJ-type ribon-helix-helix transcriptional regulator
MSRSKTQLSVTVSTRLVADVERGVRAGRFRSRSAAVESALQAWVRRQRAAEIHAYYDEVTDDELAEDLAWAKLGRRALGKRG